MSTETVASSACVAPDMEAVTLLLTCNSTDEYKKMELQKCKCLFVCPMAQVGLMYVLGLSQLFLSALLNYFVEQT